MNPNRNSGLYRYDMRPVFKSSATNQHWVRLRSSVKYQKGGSDGPPLSFEHTVDNADGIVSFAFTYPYTYAMVQKDLDALNAHVNDMTAPDSIYFKRELLTNTPDGRRVDLYTITSVDGASNEQEALLPGLFPESISSAKSERPLVFPNKEIVFVSARVHPGEVPAQHTWKGIHDFLLDPNDIRAIALRRKYVFKIVPILNPDGKCHAPAQCKF
jgi:cytosolic carboxypeptidase protein 5